MRPNRTKWFFGRVFLFMAGRTVKIVIEQVAAGGNAGKKVIDDLNNHAERATRKRVADENRAARDVERIHRQTAANAARSEKVIERAQRERLREIGREQKRAADDFLRQMKRMESASGRGSSPTGGSSIRGAAFSGGFAGGIAASVISSVTSAATQGGQALLDYSSKLESTKIGFESLLGSGEKAQVLLKQIQDFAKSTPFEFQGLTEAAQRFLGVNVEASKIIPLMKDVGNIVAATGNISQERLEGVSTAISQIIGKTKFSAEENEQLAERGINGFQILSQATGKSQAELRKLSEQGKISADVFIQALQKVSKEKYGDAMEKQSKTFSGAMSNVKDSVLIAASTAFQPLYTEMSKVAVNLAKEIEAEGGNLTGIGEVIGRYIVAGMTSALAAGTKGIFSYLAKNIKSQFSDNPETFAPLKLTELLVEGVGQGLGYNIDVFARNLSGANATAGLLNTTLKDTEKTVVKLPSIADKLEADKAKKESEFLLSTVRDLAFQIQFFGDSSQVAATKQKLLSQGIRDFDTGLAKTALTAAAFLDKLKANQKEQEEYNQKLKSAQDYMKDLREEADFKINFPKANQMDDFNRWVQKNTVGLRGLQTEVDITREKIEKLLFANSAADRDNQINNFNESVKQALDGFSETADDFESKYKQLIKNLVEPLGIKESDNFVQNLFSRFPQWREEVEQVSRDVDFLIEKGIINQADREKKIAEETSKVHTEQRERMRVWLETFKKQAGDREINIFGISTGDFEFVDKFIALYNGLANSMKSDQLKTGTDTLDSVIANLGLRLKTTTGEIIGAKTPLDILNAQLADPLMTAAIEERAKSIGKTTEEFKKLLIETQKSVGFNNLKENLDEQLESLQRGGRALTEYERTLKALETTYKDLDDKQKQDLLNTAAQIDATEAFLESQEKIQSFFENVFDKAFSGNWKSLLDDLLGQLKAFLVKAAAMFATSKIFGGGSSGGGFNFGSLFGGGQGGGFGGIFGGSNGQGGLSSIINGGGIRSALGIGGTALGLGGASAALGATSAASGGAAFAAANASAAGAAGVAAGGASGGLGALGGLLTNPWTIAAVGAAVGGLLLWKLFQPSALDKLKKAAQSQYSVNIKDKSTLQALKTVGEGYFGKGQAGKKAVETVQTPEGKELIENYAASTGQKSSALEKANYGDENWKGNQFKSKFGGFREFGGNVRAGEAYVVGEKRAELFIPNTSGRIEPNLGGNGMAQMLGQMMSVFSEIRDQLSTLQTASAGDIIMKNGSAVADAYENEMGGDYRRTQNLSYNTGGRI